MAKRLTLCDKIAAVVERARKASIADICDEIDAPYDSVRKAIQATANVVMQDGGTRAYLCSSSYCGYEGRRHCQNCGYAKGERDGQPAFGSVCHA